MYDRQEPRWDYDADERERERRPRVSDPGPDWGTIIFYGLVILGILGALGIGPWADMPACAARYGEC